MATTAQDINGNWTLVQLGPIDSIGLQAVSGTILYKISSVLPDGSDNVGHVLERLTGHTITLDASENIYAKSLNTYTTQLIRTT